MNIRELILDSKEVIEKIDAGESITLNFLCRSLDIEESKLMELFEKENVVIDFDRNESISADLFKQILLKEPETSSSPNNLRELILSSEKILEKINQDVEFVRAIFLCRNLDVGMKSLRELFKREGIEITSTPTFRISTIVLKQLVAPKKTLIPDVEDVLKKLEFKIEKLGEKEYQKNVVLNQFIRSESIREYAKIRANGICELCENPAPFNDRYGNPFLETHHIVYLSKGGKDTIDNVAAICPNCHRKIHNLNLDSDVEKLLRKRNSNWA